MSRFARVAAATLLPALIGVLAACGGGVGGATGTPGSSPSATAPASVEPSAPASAEPSASAAASSALNQLFPAFEAQGGSSITGGAILTDLGDGTTAVTIGVVAAGITEPMPASIVPSTCASPGASGAPGASASAEPPASADPSASAAAPLDPLAPIPLPVLAAGASNTVINLALSDLTATPHSITILMSAADSTVVACADIEE